jgi:hypothetical protein
VASINTARWYAHAWIFHWQGYWTLYSWYVNLFRSKQQLPEIQKAKLILTGVKGEARDVIMGYADKEVNTTGKILKILKNEFKKREKSARNLHQFKQDSTEKISIFAGRIRRYVRGLGVRTKIFNKTCIEFMKIGALRQIQGRLYQRNPKSFARAIRIAIEAEEEKP